MKKKKFVSEMNTLFFILTCRSTPCIGTFVSNGRMLHNYQIVEIFEMAGSNEKKKTIHTNIILPFQTDNK